jgi:hypothetical protein
MSSGGNGASIPYAVVMSLQTKALVKELHVQAVQNGTGQQFLSALRKIIERLRGDPFTFGEPLYRLPALNLLVCQAIVLPLVVIFGINQERPIVIVRGFKVLS